MPDERRDEKVGASPMAMLDAGRTSFTCRRRTMSVTADEAALAGNGEIRDSLRQRSPVYYWRKTAQGRSRHEAVCTKRGAWHVLTFGSHAKYALLAGRKCFWPETQVSPSSRYRKKSAISYLNRVPEVNYQTKKYETPQNEPSDSSSQNLEAYLLAKAQASMVLVEVMVAPEGGAQ